MFVYRLTERLSAAGLVFGVVLATLLFPTHAGAHHRTDHATGKPSPTASPTAPAQSCDVVVDPHGDARNMLAVSSWDVTPLPFHASLDLVGGDVASNDSHITVIFKLVADPRAGLDQAHAVRAFRAYLRADGNPDGLLVSGYYGATGETYGWHYYYDSRIQKSSLTRGYYDEARQEIRITIAISDLPNSAWWAPGVRPIRAELHTVEVYGARLEHPFGETIFGFNPRRMSYVDITEHSEYYWLGNPSCREVETI